MIASFLVIGVFRHGTALLYFVFCFFLLLSAAHPLQILKESVHRAMALPFLLLTLLGALGLMSTLWSVMPLQTLTSSLLNFLTIASFSVFFTLMGQQDSPQISLFLRYTPILFFSSFLILFLQLVTDHSIRFLLEESNRSLKPNVEVLALLFFPVFGYYLTRQQYLWSALALIGTLLATYMVEIRTSFLALLIGGFCALLFYLRPYILSIVFAVGSFVYCITLPWIFYALKTVDFLTQFQAFPSSFIHRLYIWRYVSLKITEKPWLGWGATVSHKFPMDQVELPVPGWGLLPSHPHNYILQLWLENGFLGVLLLALFQSALFWNLRHQRHRLFASLSGFYLSATIVMLSMSHSLWHKWWICWIALCGGLLKANENYVTFKRPTS